jgi:very-short-patch-repair endonuclease
MENVVTRRRDRISADEEERLRLGYDIQTGLRFSQRSDSRPNQRQAEVIYKDEKLFTLTYAPTATLWRINLGWTRRKNKEQHGFILDMERGYWAKNDQLETHDDTPLSSNTKRVIPYVEDSRNCLLFEPVKPLALADMASLQAALKRAIETVFQLEDNELAAEPLPNPDTRHLLLFYESAEGGAGVLRQLVDNPQQLARVAKEALRLCHFDPESGEDLRHAPNAKEDCEAACYNCLLSYGNQREHRILDRMLVRDILHTLSEAEVQHSPSAQSRASHLHTLLERCDSDLEREWLNFLAQRGLRLPDHAQHFIEACRTRPDFLYDSQGIFAAIYIDGPQHDYPQRQKRDSQQSACMEDAGYIVLRFSYRQQWEQLIRDYHAIFGGLR